MKIIIIIIIIIKIKQTGDKFENKKSSQNFCHYY